MVVPSMGLDAFNLLVFIREKNSPVSHPKSLDHISFIPRFLRYRTTHNPQFTPVLTTPQIPFKERNPFYDRMLFRCFIVKKLISKNRSTQLARHPSSPLSSFDPLMFPVTHFFQQICVKLCVSAFVEIKFVSTSFSPSSSLALLL